MQDQELRSCQNCEQSFPINKIDLHEAYCRRNIRRCQLCSKMVDVNDQQSHHNQFHAQTPCEYCKETFYVRQLAEHTENCMQRPSECKYCENMYPFASIPKHEDSCGARTRMCDLCHKYIKIKDEKDHKQKCQGPQLRRNESQQLSRQQRNPMPRERMNSNDHHKKQMINGFSPRLLPKKNAQTVTIERQPISQIVDPVPISIRLAMMREKEKRRHK